MIKKQTADSGKIIPLVLEVKNSLEEEIAYDDNFTIIK